MDHSPPVADAPQDSRRRYIQTFLQANGVSKDDLNSALLQAASRGHKHILQILIDAGATNLVGAMTCAGWSGHSHIVDAIVLRTRPVPFDAAFVGALVGLRKDTVQHVVRMADTAGLNKCLLMGAARMWSCSTLEEVGFLLNAIECLAKAGAKNFQRAMQVACGDAVIEYWNGLMFKEKANILERLVVLGSSYMTADFYGRILLMTCVTFLSKLTKSQDKLLPTNGSMWVKQFGYMILDSKTRDSQCSETIVQDMMNIISVVCRNGAADLVSSRLLEITDCNIVDVRSLLQITDCLHQGVGATGECANCRAEWPLKLMKFLLVDCGIKDLSITVTVLPVFQAARLDVLFPVVQCFLEQNCYDASFVYLDMSISFCQGEAIQYLLTVMPKPIDTINVVDAVRAAVSKSRGPLRGPEGMLFALHANFLDDHQATMREAATLAELVDTDRVVKKRLREEWSQQAFDDGIQAGKRHFLNLMLVRRRSQMGFACTGASS